MNNQLVTGSIGAIAKKENISLAESFLSAEMIVLLDNSGSMSSRDEGMTTRADRANEQLRKLQATHPGKIALICFADYAAFSPGGIVIPVGGGTDMIAALQFAKPADGIGVKIVLISDGEPNDPGGTLQLAQTFQTKIDAIYIGSEMGYGRDFLQQLTAATGGNFFKSAMPGQLESEVEQLLLQGGM